MGQPEGLISRPIASGRALHRLNKNEFSHSIADISLCRERATEPIFWKVGSANPFLPLQAPFPVFCRRIVALLIEIEYGE
jgi:hypothetical protein